MPTLEHDRLVFRFPQIEEDASFSIDFQRTLRIPDSDKTYPLPPGLGRFPLRHVEDHSKTLPEHTIKRGGVFLPIWQAEAMWLNFHNSGPHGGLPFPVAIKIAAGKINAVTGESWRAGLNRQPQDYVVSPKQPWLDGFAVAKGVIRQFVAMPLGEGYSAEEQLTGNAEWGGLQISVVPLKADVWQSLRAEWEAWEEALKEALKEEETRIDHARYTIMPLMSHSDGARSKEQMGLSPGGKMRQKIEADPYNLDDWDFEAADRVFITLVHAKDWKTITGEAAPNQPPTAREYTKAGLPWFDYYGCDQTALPGSEKLAGLKSLAVKYNEQTGHTLPDSEDLDWFERRLPRGLHEEEPRSVRSEFDGN